MQARYYDPVIGRFLSIDPVGFTPDQPGMFNRYAYTLNDPVNAVDPDGEWAQVLLGAAVGAVVGGAINAYSQYQAIQAGTQDGFRAGEFAVASVAGAAVGAATSVGVNPALAAGVVNGFASVATDAVNGEITNAESAARSAVKGLAVGAISAVVAPVGKAAGGAVGGAVFQKTLESGKGGATAYLAGTIVGESTGTVASSALSLAGTTSTAGPLNATLDAATGAGRSAIGNAGGALQQGGKQLQKSQTQRWKEDE